MSGMDAPSEFELPVHGAAIAGAPEGIGESLDALPEPELLETPGLDADPQLEFRRTLGMFATGVTVITVVVDEQMHGMTANAFMSVSLSPPLILISIDRKARMNAMLGEGVRFGVSVLEAGQRALSDRFAGRTGEATPEPRFEIVHATPLVEGALAHLVARVVRSYWGGDHSLFLGRVEYVYYGEGTPLLFHGGRYERVVRDPNVFAALPAELLQPLLATGVETSFADGEPLMRRGEPGDTLYLVLGGGVKVERPGRSFDLGPGAVVGEIEVLDPGAGRIADVIAVGEVRALRVTRADLRTALGTQPQAALALIEILASRFRELS
jgi:flavin reductase (DIM6/NTAB) family NADH-FMN oxidoreductase RutF